jgi:hypothetical protein
VSETVWALLEQEKIAVKSQGLNETGLDFHPSSNTY